MALHKRWHDLCTKFNFTEKEFRNFMIATETFNQVFKFSCTHVQLI